MATDNRPLRILHISALQLWAMEGQAGMCCLDETLRGHRRAGYEIMVIVPGHDLWDEGATTPVQASSAEFEVHIAPCRYLPLMKRLRSWVTRTFGEGHVSYFLRWPVGVGTWLLLSVSLFLAAMRVRYRRGWRFDMVYAHCEYAALGGYLVRLVCRVPNVTRLYGTFAADLMKKPLICLRYPIAAAGFVVPHSRLICANDGTRGDEVARRMGLNLTRFRFWQDAADPQTRTSVGRHS